MSTDFYWWHEQAVEHYRDLLDEAERRAVFLANELDALTRLLERAATARTDAWGADEEVEVVCAFVSQGVPAFWPSLTRLARLLDGA